MDNKAVRKRNIEWLVGRADGPGDFARQIGRDPVQISQWLGGKNIGDRLARHIETALGKGVGWLDQPQWTDVPGEPDRASAATITKSQSPGLDEERLASSIEWLRDLFATWRRDFDALKHARLIALVYDELSTPAKPNLVQLSQTIARQIEEEASIDERQSKARRA